jgi:hypothetical protein
MRNNRHGRSEATLTRTMVRELSVVGQPEFDLGFIFVLWC